MGGLIPLTDASRRPVHLPVLTVCIILTNFIVFALELVTGEPGEHRLVQLILSHHPFSVRRE